MRTGFVLLVLAAGLPTLAGAHHSHASLNRDDVRTMQGVVTGFMWRSPHVYLQADVIRDDGSVANYTMELANPMSMGRSGWNKTSLEPGDRITWQGAHDRDANRAYMGLNWVEVEGEPRLYASAAEQKKYLEQSGGDLPDYLQEAAPPEPATTVGEGTWSRIGADGGRFRNIYSPELIMDWPLTDKARKRIGEFQEGDNPINQCIFNGPPRSILSLSNFKWSRTDNAVIIDRDLWPEPRVIHLDADAPPPAPSRLGHSVGRFEDGELHVETGNFIADDWAIYWGLDSSEQLSLYERYWLSDDGMRLNVEFTISDPVMLTEPVTLTHQWGKVADRDLIKAECSMENANFFLTAGYE